MAAVSYDMVILIYGNTYCHIPNTIGHTVCAHPFQYLKLALVRDRLVRSTSVGQRTKGGVGWSSRGWRCSCGVQGVKEERVGVQRVRPGEEFQRKRSYGA